MPLLKGRFLVPVEPKVEPGAKGTLYTIQHTGEKFTSKDEYEKKLRVYESQLWTCQCTGHINLTHKEAIESESQTRKQIKEKFPEVFEKTVLDIVHHSSENLDTLVDTASLQLYEYMVVGEPASLRLKAGNKTITGFIVKTDPQSKENGSSSPSSDKENRENKSDSPRKGGANNVDPPKSPYKGLPKLAPCKYSFKLASEDKIINGIPHADLLRPTKIPSKDILKLFIRSFASRGGYFFNSPWIVDGDLCKKYNIKDKAVGNILSPQKRYEMGKKAFDDTVKECTKAKSRRSSSASVISSPVRYGSGKKLLLDPKAKSQTDVRKSPTKQTKLSFSSKKSDMSSPAVGKSPVKSPVKAPSTPKKSRPSRSQSSSDSEEEISLAELKSRSPTKSPKLAKQKSRSKSSKSESESEEEISLAELIKRSPSKSPRKKSTSSQSEGKSSSQKSSKEKSKDAKSIKENKEGKNKEKKDKKEGKSKEKKEKNSKPEQSGKGKTMKQATLFDMKGSKTKTVTDDGKNSSKKNSPVKTPKKNKQPLIVEKLLKEINKKGGGLKSVVAQLAFKCARELNEKQRKNLPESVSELVHSKWEKVEEKKKLDKMTPEEKKEYFKQKHKQKMKEIMKNRVKKAEDTEMKLKPLPVPKLVPTPDGLPNELFGDVVMMTEFINCYKGLLMQDDEYPIYTESLLKSLGEGKEGFHYLGKVLKVLLQTLLQDDLTSDYKELMVPLSEIPVSTFTSSELVRLCLRKRDADDGSYLGSDDSEESEQEWDEIPEELLEKLETSEVYELAAVEKLQILKGLCDRLMGSYSVQDYMQEKITESSKMWLRRNKALKEKNDLLKKEKEMNKGKKEAQKEGDKKDGENKDGLTLNKFYGGAKDSGVEDSEPEDMATIIKRRRINAAKEKEERTKREKEEREKREQEYELNKQLMENEKIEKTYNEVAFLAKAVQRVTPIGTDRNHNRYWIFPSSSPGVFVEKGWATKDIGYSVRAKDAESDSDDSSSSSDDEEENEKRGRPKGRKCHDKTFPHVGQNLWFLYDTQEELDKLLEGLNDQATREGPLKRELGKHYNQIKDRISKAQKSNNETKDTDEEGDLIESFREELLDMENRLSAGGLGGVSNYSQWEEKLNAATTIEEFGNCLKDTQDSVLEKFLTGMLIKEVKRSKLEKKEPEDAEAEVDSDDDEEVSEDKDVNVAADELVPIGKIKWREAIDNCTTWSRLHVLMGILDSCLKWEKSAENAKCKICNRKGDEEALLLCDDCNKAFHMYCLRPRLDDVPQGEWFCAACIPPDQRRRSRVPKSRHAEGDEDVFAHSDEEIQHDTQCIICTGDEKLIFCATCPSAFHLDCHEPPLRREPRKTWRCMQCTSGIRIRKSRRAAAKKRKRYDDDFVEDWEDEDEKPSKRKKTEEEIVKEDTSKSRSERYKNRYGMDDSGTELDEKAAMSISQELEDYLETSQTRRSSRSNKRSLNYNDPEDESDSEVPVVKKQKRESNTPDEPTTPPKKKKPRSKPRINGEIDTHEYEMKQAKEILGRLRRHRCSWPFQDPVDTTLVPDYKDVVEHPMDFLTIKKKCDSDQYKKVTDFVDDLALVFSNCELYNKPETDIYKCMAPLEKIIRENLQRLLPGVCYPRNGNPMLDHDYL